MTWDSWDSSKGRERRGFSKFFIMRVGKGRTGHMGGNPPPKVCSREDAVRGRLIIILTELAPLAFEIVPGAGGARAVDDVEGFGSGFSGIAHFWMTG